MKMRAYKLYTNVRSSLWLVPVLCVLVGAVISFVTLAIDRANDYQLVPPTLVGGPDAALAILGTVATSMVSLTALVLTIVLVVVQLAMGQFSPRSSSGCCGPPQSVCDRPVRGHLRAHAAGDSGSRARRGRRPGSGAGRGGDRDIRARVVLHRRLGDVRPSRRSGVANPALVELAGGDTRRLLDKVYSDAETPAPGTTDPHLLHAEKSGVLTTVAHHQLVDVAREGGCFWSSCRTG